jgi:hypothetical protein
MDGWKTVLAFFAEDAPTERFRPGGIRSIRVATSPLQSWSRKSPFERRGREKSLIDSIKITVTRDFSNDDYLARLMESICDTWTEGAGSIGPEPKATDRTYALDVQFPDGVIMRYTGLALKSLNIMIQSGRVMEEESVFIALKAELLETITGAAPAAAVLTPASRAQHSIDTSLPEITTAAWPGAATRTFSSQIAFERTLAACNHKRSGEATRHTKSAWEITGQSIVRLPTSDFRLALNEDTEAALHWIITKPESASELKIALCNARIRVNNQEALGGEIEHSIDFQAHSADNQTAYISAT